MGYMHAVKYTNRKWNLGQPVDDDLTKVLPYLHIPVSSLMLIPRSQCPPYLLPPAQKLVSFSLRATPNVVSWPLFQVELFMQSSNSLALYIQRYAL